LTPQEQELAELAEVTILPQEDQEPEFLIQDMTVGALPAVADSGDSNAEDKAPRSTTTKPPSADEWQEFLGCTVLRLLTEGYLWLFLFRDIDESMLTPRELDSIKLTKDELREIAAPVAVVASKNKLARKHGRTIMASAESYESLIDLVIWMRRVRKISRRYHGKTVAEDTHVTEGVVIEDGPLQGQNQPSGVNIAGIRNFGTG